MSSACIADRTAEGAAKRASADKSTEICRVANEILRFELTGGLSAAGQCYWCATALWLNGVVNRKSSSASKNSTCGPGAGVINTTLHRPASNQGIGCARAKCLDSHELKHVTEIAAGNNVCNGLFAPNPELYDVMHCLTLSQSPGLAPLALSGRWLCNEPTNQSIHQLEPQAAE